jgi:hypothetical protein
MLRLIEFKGDVDIYQFEDEVNNDTRKSLYVDVYWHDNKPHANHPTTMVSYMVELQLKKTGRQKIGDTLE